MIQVPSSEIYDAELIVTIKHARRKLGKTSEALSDETIREMIIALQQLAIKQLDSRFQNHEHLVM